MVPDFRLRFLTGVLLTMSASFAFVNIASAKTYVMSGTWFMNRGELIDVPINLGPESCDANSNAQGCVGNATLGGADNPLPRWSFQRCQVDGHVAQEEYLQ